jgi:hypothetical protein
MLETYYSHARWAGVVVASNEYSHNTLQYKLMDVLDRITRLCKVTVLAPPPFYCASQSHPPPTEPFSFAPSLWPLSPPKVARIELPLSCFHLAAPKSPRNTRTTDVRRHSIDRGFLVEMGSSLGCGPASDKRSSGAWESDRDRCVRCGEA